ncbi:MAG TPA: 4-(cytidine 5'-diphospho)-2-C-methyl-D-erythritol kinase [Clostridia bacterium]|nr:4-(cytidine 5'-diphospho)-2-C-methyl-D-erythritol kinase [Clostridia bacterium]
MIVEKAYAKLNIGLDIIGKMSDGYHSIDTIMQTIELHDLVTADRIPSGILINCSKPDIPTDSRNTVYRAAEVFFAKSVLNTDMTGVRFHIEKNIPVQAGLGGGSSDAAAALRALNSLFCTGYGTDELIELASKVGSDVPFLIEGGTMRARGRGEQLEKMKDFKGISTVIVMPGESVSTPMAYSLFSGCKNPRHPDMDSLVQAIENMNVPFPDTQDMNTFESLIFPLKPLIEKAKHAILETNPFFCTMTGSGSAVYGFYRSEEDATKAYEVLSGRYDAYLTRTTGGVF